VHSLSVKDSEENVKGQDIEVEFTGKNITPFGGLILFGKFFQALDIEKLVEEYLPLKKKRKGKYAIAVLFIALLHLILTGIERVSHSEVFKDDKTFKAISGIYEIASRSTYFRFLKSFHYPAIKLIQKIRDILFYSMWDITKGIKEVTLDFDLSVIPVFGKHQGAKIGYNPKRKGSPSYFPFFCFLFNLECIHGNFRGGWTPKGSEMVKFIEESIDKVKVKIKQLK